MSGQLNDVKADLLVMVPGEHFQPVCFVLDNCRLSVCHHQLVRVSFLDSFGVTVEGCMELCQHVVPASSRVHECVRPSDLVCQKHDQYTQVLCILGGRYLIELPMSPHDIGVQSFPVWIVFLLTGQWIQPSPSVLRSPFTNLSVLCFLHPGSRQYCQFWILQSSSTCCRNMRR